MTVFYPNCMIYVIHMITCSKKIVIHILILIVLFALLPPSSYGLMMIQFIPFLLRVYCNSYIFVSLGQWFILIHLSVTWQKPVWSIDSMLMNSNFVFTMYTIRIQTYGAIRSGVGWKDADFLLKYLHHRKTTATIAC